MYPPLTRKEYERTAADFLGFLQPRTLAGSTLLDAEAFLLVRYMECRLAGGAYIRAIDALEQLAATTPGMGWGPGDLERPWKAGRMPRVLQPVTVNHLLQMTHDIKHRCIIGLLYGGALRPGELLNLKNSDVREGVRWMTLRDVSGDAVRNIPLPGRLVQWLMAYQAACRPVQFLFEGCAGRPNDPAYLKFLLRESARKLGLQRRIGPSTLRYSFARHLLDSGLDSRWIAYLLGRSDGGRRECPGGPEHVIKMVNRVFG